MKKLIAPLTAVFFIGCMVHSQPAALKVKIVLPKELKEISGMVAAGKDVWAITDKPKANIYKLDTLGNLVEEVNIKNVEATDVEAVTADENNLYVGDVGDNNGDREERKIFKLAKANIPAGKKAEVTGEVISFTFPNEVAVENKKLNNYDCESLLSYKDSLYVFTKDREDKETRLFAVPKVPGTYTAPFIDSFNSKGLVTDAAINQSDNEVALIGYRKGHHFPFIILFKDFNGSDFFSGKHKRLELADKDWDWQLESITYNKANMLYFSCEGTKEVPATFYGINRDKIMMLDKKNDHNKEKPAKEKDNAHMSTKGHLKL